MATITPTRVAGVVTGAAAIWFTKEFITIWRYLKRRHDDIEEVGRSERVSPTIQVDNTIVNDQQFDACVASLDAQITDRNAGLLQIAPPIVHDIGRESCAILAGGPAALLQLAHPYVAYGVKHHSYTKHNVTLRFFKTFEFVFAIGFGDMNTAMRASRTVRNLHSRVNGCIEQHAGPFPQGHTYTAHQEDALLWVLTTLLDWQIVMYEICVRQLTDSEKDTFYDYHRRICRVWGISPRLLPPDWRSFRDRCYRMFANDQLTVTPAARDMATFLMAPPLWERIIGVYTLEMVTATLLPSRIRQAYSLRYGHTQVWGTVAFFAAIRMAYTILPRSFRSFTSYMRYQQRVTGASQLPILTRLAAATANLFLRLYFGRHSLKPAPSPISSGNSNDHTNTNTNGEVTATPAAAAVA